MEITQKFSTKTYLLTVGFLLGLTALALYGLGRPLYCPCGYVKLWHSSVFDAGVSQHLVDWYSFTHVVHGFLLYALLSWLLPDLPAGSRLLLAVALEGSWEIVENTQYVIEYYRNNTMAVNFSGDTILNSMTDILAMMGGYALADGFSRKVTAGLFLGVETLTILMIRDSLTLNILMFFYPIEAIKNWQMALM